MGICEYHGKAREKCMGVPCGAQNNVLLRARDLVFACNITSCVAVSQLDAKEVGEEKITATVVFNFA